MSRALPRHVRLLALGAVVMLASAFGGRDATSDARRDANRFVLEKLNRERGEGWNRSGQFFLWHYAFSRNGCDLTIRREAVEGGQIVVQDVPMADVVPVWMGTGSLGLYCQSQLDCIDLRISNRLEAEQEGQLSETPLLVPEPDDLPKLKDAFDELHRLCDDAYRER